MFINSSKILLLIIFSTSLASCTAVPINNILNSQDKPAIAPPIHDSRLLELNKEQNANLMKVAGLLLTSPFTAGLLDINHNKVVDVNDRLVIYNKEKIIQEVSQRPLTENDVFIINSNNNPNLNEANQQLINAEILWKKNRPYAYSYILKRSCFCPPGYPKPIEIHVREEQLRLALELPNKIELPKERSYEAKTPEQLFTMIREAITKNAPSVQVVYDSNHGLPINIRIDQDAMLADEEINIKIEQFKVSSSSKN